MAVGAVVAATTAVAVARLATVGVERAVGAAATGAAVARAPATAGVGCGEGPTAQRTKAGQPRKATASGMARRTISRIRSDRAERMIASNPERLHSPFRRSEVPKQGLEP